METRISTLLIDLGGVILNIDYHLTIDAFKRIGISDFESVYSQAKQGKVFDDLETGKISGKEFKSYLRKALNQPDISDLTLDNAWNKMLLDLPEERITLLKRLKKKYKLLLFSNTNEIHYEKFRSILKASYGNENLLETLFDTTYYSHILGVRKPHKESFKKILELESLDPGEVIFFDDSIQHIHGAIEAGISSRHLIDNDIIAATKDLI
ncbi:HAD-IA family hydrolase [Crocinitomix algicola]|uniref:HAD-IA family hydrolase n=1 Tax=Crocinitomix algicola TaxID=1740263 RepID=UPI00082D7450|nr:HAD-IA family hydrolase [Crocinitomix algicola]